MARAKTHVKPNILGNCQIRKKTKAINTLAEQLGVLPKNISLTISEERLKDLLSRESIFWLEQSGNSLIQIGVCIGTCGKKNIIGC